MKIKGFVILTNGDPDSFLGAHLWARFYEKKAYAKKDTLPRFGHRVYPATVTVRIPKKKTGNR